MNLNKYSCMLVDLVEAINEISQEPADYEMNTHGMFMCNVCISDKAI